MILKDLFNYKDPMDMAELAAIKRLIEMDTEGSTDFYTDDLIFTKKRVGDSLQMKGIYDI